MLEPAIRAPQFMRVFANAQPPYGFVRFCEAQPNECTSNDRRRCCAFKRRLSG